MINYAPPIFEGDPRMQAVKIYEYSDAASFLADFWRAIDGILRERGVISWKR